jgi:hypothetical protein
MFVAYLLTLMEEHVLRKILATKRSEVTGRTLYEMAQ